MTVGSGTAATVRPSARDDGEGVTLDLVRALCDRLTVEGIGWCHWKSNEALDRSARGDNDLDLLVARAEAQRFEEILTGLGFREAVSPAWKELPGVFHWYGLDVPSGRLVHVHAYHQLVIGDDMTKNVRLPIEAAYLASSVPRSPFMVPAPTFELGVFLVRMILKHCTWDAIAVRHGSLSASERRELAQLIADVDMPTLWATMERALPSIDRTLWERCMQAVQPTASLAFRIRTGRKLERALSACVRRPRAVNTWLKVWRRGRLAVYRRMLRRPPVRRRLRTGGVLIGVVGGDGAGKSTVVEELSRWLGAHIMTASVHLGKPPRSMSSRLARRAMKLAASVRRAPTPSRVALLDSLADPADGSLDVRGKARLVWECLTARDRQRAYRRARRAATQGAVVVCDRFPLRSVRLMDAAVTGSVDLAGRPRWFRALAAYERRCYERIAPPDQLIVLRVHPDIAVRRRVDERESLVRPRSEEIWRSDWRDMRAVVIDSSRPKDEMMAEVRSAMWSRL